MGLFSAPWACFSRQGRAEFWSGREGLGAGKWAFFVKKWAYFGLILTENLEPDKNSKITVAQPWLCTKKTRALL
jgi:hypothetical protein